MAKDQEKQAGQVPAKQPETAKKLSPVDELMDYTQGEFVVLKKDGIAALIHDLVRGYTQAWVGAGAKNKLVMMIVGIGDRSQVEAAYQHLKAHDNAKG